MKCLTDWEGNVNRRVGLEAGLRRDVARMIAFPWEESHIAKQFGKCLLRF